MLFRSSEFSLFLFDLHDEKKVKEKSQELKQCFKALVFIGEKDKYETHRLLSKHIKEKTDASLADYFAEEEGFDAIRFFKERLFSRIQKKVELSEDSTQIGMYRELVVDSAAELGKPDQIFDLMSSNTLEQRRERSGRYVMSYMRSFVRANRSPVGDEIQLIEKGVKEHASKFVLNSYMNLLNSLNFPISKIVQLMSLKNDDGINIVYGDLINYVTFLRILSQDLQLSRDEKTNWVNDCVRAVYKNNGKLLDERSREDQLSFELECLAVLVKSSSYEEVTQFITAYGNIITEQQERYRYFSISMEALFYDTQMRMEEKVSCVIDMMSKMEDEDYSKRWVTLALDMFEQSGHSGLVNKIIGKVSTIYQLRAFLETVKFKLTIKRCKENYQKTRKTIQTLLGSPKKKLLTADEKVALSNAKNWLLQLDEKVKTEYAAFQDKLNLKIMGLKDKNKASYTVERVANDVYDCIVDYHLVHYTDFNSKLSYFLSCYPKSVPLSKKSNQVQVEDLETAYEQDSYTYTMHLGVSALNFFIKDSATVLFFSTDKTKIALELCLVFQFFRVCSTIEKNQVEDPLPSWDKSYAKEFQDLATCYESYQSKSEFELRTTFETLLNQWNSKIAKGYLVYLLKVAQVGAYTLIETIMSEIKRRHPNEIQEEDYHYLLKALNNNRNMLPEVKLEHVKNITYNVLVRNSECRSAHETMSQTLPKLLFPELYNLELNAILKASKNWFAQIQTYTEANVSDYFSDLKQLFSQYLNLQSSLMGLCEQGVDKTGSEARLRVKKGQHGLPYVECNTKDGGFLEGFLGYLYTKREGEWSGLPYRCRNLVDILFITCSKKQDDYTRFTHTQDEMRLLQWNEDRYFKIENKNVKELDSFLFLDSEALLKTAIGDIMEKLWIYFIERVNQLLDTKSICSERLFKDAFIIYASLGAFPQLGEVLQFLKQSKDERLNLYSGRFVSLFFKSFLFSTDPSAAIFLKATLKSMASAVLDQEKQALLQTYIESHFSKEKHEELIYNILDLLFGAYSGVERDKKMSSFLDATALTIPNLDERREFSDMLIKAQDKMELTTLEQQEMHAEINHWKERAGHFKIGRAHV